MRDHRLDVGEEKKMDDARGVPHVAEEGHNQFKGTTVQSTTNVGLRKQDPHASNNNNSRPASSEAPTTAAPVPPSAASPTAPPTKKNSQPFGRFARWVGTFIRLLLLDAPLTLLFAAVLLVGSFERYAHTILLPQIELMRFADSPTKVERGLTYYHRLCTAADQTATDPSAFTLSATSDTTTTTTQQAVHLMLKHGITIIPNVLSESTATQLRDFILRENAVTKDLIHVIANEHRWSFPIRVDQDPIVTQALEELLNAPRLVRILEAVAGPNPAIVEFTAITQEYGAKEQFWHQDVTADGSSVKYARSFVPTYSLFIPLQNVTAKMGATGICPGSHICSDGCRDYCYDTGFQVSGSNDNWPLGAGALVNQQTTHRGAAHTDPDGPHRALFILTFTPRPQTLPGTVETRMIGVSGSYSLHWSQWGHTLSDFQRPSTNMAHPWRELKSLGIYKAKASQWGWDYLTVGAGRIANEDTGYTLDDLGNLVADGELRWFGRRLWSNLREENIFTWGEFLMDTVANCRETLMRMYRLFFFLYVLIFTFFLVLSRNRRCEKWTTTASKLFLQLAAVHAVLVLLAWSTSELVDQNHWNRNILSKRSFSLAEMLTLYPDLPETLPTEEDVLFVEGYQSDYFHTNARVLDIAHPGNNAFNALLAIFSTGYTELSTSFQQQIRQSLLLRCRQDHRRILVQTSSSNWAEASSQIANWYSHKSLCQRSDQRIHAAVQTLEFLLSELRYGYWRDSKSHARFVAPLVVGLRDKVLGLPMRHDTVGSSKLEITDVRRPVRTFLVLSRLKDILPRETRSSLHLVRDHNSIPNPTPQTVEPFPGAWMQAKDIVEANFEGDTQEWYRARITYANSNSMTWDVDYDDGEEGVELCQKCVRPFVPYAVGEYIEVRMDEHSYAAGVIHAVHGGDESLFDVKLSTELTSVDSSKGDSIRTRIPTKDLRRRNPESRKKRIQTSKQTQLTVRTRVMSQVPGLDDDESYPGVITKVNPDGTFSVMFDDGDFVASVPRRMIAFEP